MDVLCSVAAMRAWRRARGGSVGFVPTMGYLHEGHLSLVRQARAENDVVVASIFVNPAQFGPNEDFERYPRDEVRDLALLEGEGVAAVYLPSVAEMYSEGYLTYVTVEGLSEGLEGEVRPGHFRGVATVVLKLFNTVEPTRAYFGKKDAQQLRVIQRMVSDLDVPVAVVPCEIVREPDGLAMSSRNVYLSPENRLAATVIHRALAQTKTAFDAGERDAERLRRMVSETLRGEPGAAIDYVSLTDGDTLAEIKGALRVPALLSVAVRLGTTRLLDNVDLG